MNSSSRNVDERIRLAFLIRSLGVGGAERQLATLARRIDSTRFDCTVFCFYGGGFFHKELIDAGVRVIDLHKGDRWEILGFLFRLVARLRQFSPHILHSYLGMANIIGLLVKPITGRPKVVFGIRYSMMDLDRYDWLFRFEYKAERSLGTQADLIVANSAAAARVYSAGRVLKNLVVIRNGIDTNHFRPDRLAGRQFRQQWQIPKNVCLIGMAGRIDPMKGIPVFLAAARRILEQNPNMVFIIAGKGQPAYTREMEKLGEDLQLQSQFIWCGEQQQMVPFYNALDGFCSASYGESLSNVICEAMSCGVPCLVTDVGDSAYIVGDTGFVFPPDDPESMAHACLELAAESVRRQEERRKSARERIISHFSLEKLVSTTESVLESLIRR